jgi:Undecaprenyl-phosphate glucose phosphotransferase
VFTRFQRFYNSIKLVADALAVMLAFTLAYFTRFSLLGAESLPPTRETFITMLLSVALFPLVFRQAGLYTTSRGRSHISEVFEVFKASVLATLILVAVTYFTRERYSRGTLLVFAAYVFACVSIVRLLFRAFFNEMRRRGLNLKSILIVGAGELGLRVIETIDEHRELGFKVTSLLSRRSEKVGTQQHGVMVHGLYQDLDRVLSEHPIDQVIIALPIEEQPQLRSLMEVLALRTVDVKIVPDLLSFITLRGGLEEFGGLPMLSLQGAPLDGWNLVLKRAFDVLLSLIALLLLAPFFLALSVLVKVTSPGPIFYSQERMGMDGHLFHMLKFRSMRLNAEHSGAQFATADDPRRTSVGAFLRKYSLDELPQFWNVLTGDMSLVGPRPERKVFIDEFKKQIPRYHLRHMVKSGITGWAQVNGLRGDTNIKERIDYDLYYIENWSLAFDLKILFRTALGGFLSRNAY